MIHLMMVLADVVYGVVIVYISKYAQIPPTLTDTQFITNLEYGLAAYSVLMVIGVIITRKKILSSDSMFIIKENSKVESDEPPYFANYLSTLFILWALIETITIAGLILFLTTGELLTSLIFIIIGTFFKLSNGPTLDDLNTLSRKCSSIAIEG